MVLIIRVSRISAIRMPDFVTQTEFEWAKAEAERKKQLDLSAVGLVTIDEGECVQVMHVGPYDDEPATVARMHTFLQDSGYTTDFPTNVITTKYICQTQDVSPQ